MGCYKEKIFDIFEVESKGNGENIKIKLNGKELQNINNINISLDYENITITITQDERKNVLIRPRKFKEGNEDIFLKIK